MASRVELELEPDELLERGDGDLGGAQQAAPVHDDGGAAVSRAGEERGTTTTASK